MRDYLTLCLFVMVFVIFVNSWEIKKQPLALAAALVIALGCLGVFGQ